MILKARTDRGVAERAHLQRERPAAVVVANDAVVDGLVKVERPAC
jgi:hypothetical protein